MLPRFLEKRAGKNVSRSADATNWVFVTQTERPLIGSRMPLAERRPSWGGYANDMGGETSNELIEKDAEMSWSG